MLLQRRRIGTDAAGEAVQSPMLVKAAESVLESMHDGTLLPALGSVFSEGLALGAPPWWAAICGTTVALHLVLIVPLKICQQRTVARSQRLRPALQAWSHSVAAAQRLDADGSRMGWDAMEKQVQRKTKIKHQDFLFGQGCHPWFQLLLPLTQLPVWLATSTALRHLTGRATWLFDPEGARFPVAGGMRSEGALWFPDLALADPVCGLPVILLGTGLANVMFARRQVKNGTLMAIAQQTSWLSRTLTVVSYATPWVVGWIATFQPAGVALYWASSSALALVEAVVFRIPAVRRVLGIADPPTPPKLPIIRPAARDAQHATHQP